MTTRTRIGAAALAAVLAGLLVAGCGTAPPPELTPVAGPTASAAPTPVPSATPEPTAPPRAGTPRTAPPSRSPGAADLPWPVSGAVVLQAEVDRGKQPWLLDPAEVAISYAAAVHGWAGATADSPAGSSGSTTALVRATDGRTLSLDLGQPARAGKGGIWVVTAERPA